MVAKRTSCYEQAKACDLFDKFYNSNSLKDILTYYKEICRVCSLNPGNFQEFYPKIKSKVPSWRAMELWSKLDKRAAQACYARGKYCAETRVLIIGGGPCGLRTAIEMQLLGAKCVVIEKRASFSRNNVLHLWPFAMADLRNLGAKLMYGKFCAGSIDHISIRQLQCMLLKIALLLGVEFHENVAFEQLLEPCSPSDLGWRAKLIPKHHPVSHFSFDVVIGADGRRNSLPGFHRKALRAKLAIAITANFVHNHTEAEAKVEEISGVSYIFRQQFFQELEEAMGIALENIVYYKDETHYFVMTPTKQSLLEKGVLYKDLPDPEQLLAPENVDPEALQLFTMQAVVFVTDNRLQNLQFATNSKGEADVALFDFTTMYAAENSCRVIQRNGHKLLVGLVGDALLEPFWPTGSGIARGFLAAFDAAWMVRSWGKGLKSVCEVLAERESIHRIIAQTTHENLNKDHNQYSIDPTSRYPKINLAAVGPRQVRALYDSDQEIRDIFISIRESSVRNQVSPPIILQWFQDQLQHLKLDVKTLHDIVKNEKCILGIIKRYRPDLIEAYAEPTSNENRLAFKILCDEFNIPELEPAGQGSCFSDNDVPKLLEYLGQIYNIFKNEVPKDMVYVTEKEVARPRVAPNNSAKHYNISMQKYLEGKEKIQRRSPDSSGMSKRERRRSQFYESIMLTEGNYNQQRSTSAVNIPVVKLNPVPPGELFSACRNGSNEERFQRGELKFENSTGKLARSRSDVGFRSSDGGGVQRSPQSSGAQLRSELEEAQLRIRKSKVTPLGDIVSTFLGKHINQNSGCSANEDSEQNPLSCERKQLRPARPRSTYQNVNDMTSFHKDMSVSRRQAGAGGGISSGFSVHASNDDDTQDAGKGFRERCNFLEKSLYNSGRDLKVHIGAAWLPKEEAAQKGNHTHSTASHPLQKSQSSVLTPGFHPLKRGSSFNVRNQMEKSFNNAKNERQKGASVDGKAAAAALFERRLGELVERHVPAERRSEKIQSLRQPKSDHEHYISYRYQPQPLQGPSLNGDQRRQQQQQQRRQQLLAHVKAHNKEKLQRSKKFNEASSSAFDSDLDCFLHAIDFTNIDAQDLQELLSSY